MAAASCMWQCTFCILDSLALVLFQPSDRIDHRHEFVDSVVLRAEAPPSIAVWIWIGRTPQVSSKALFGNVCLHERTQEEGVDRTTV
eukprot:6189058-Pleurochrysis_carterae.AAC.4